MNDLFASPCRTDSLRTCLHFIGTYFLLNRGPAKRVPEALDFVAVVGLSKGLDGAFFPKRTVKFLHLTNRLIFDLESVHVCREDQTLLALDAKEPTNTSEVLNKPVIIHACSTLRGVSLSLCMEPLGSDPISSALVQ